MNWLKAKIMYGKNQYLDITDRIEYLKYTESSEKDDTVEIRIKKDYVRSTADDDRILIGNFIVFCFGEMGGKSSKVFTHKISNVEPVYEERVSLTILGTDLGNTYKKISSNSATKPATSDDIVKVIESAANEMSLKAVYSKQELQAVSTINFGPIGHESKYTWLRNAAVKCGFMCYITNKELHFKKRNLIKKPYKSYIYNDGDGELIGIRPKIRESTETAAASEVEVVSVDPLTGETKSSTSTTDQDSLGKMLNKYKDDASFAGVSGGDVPTKGENYTGAKKVVVAPDSPDNKDMAKKLNQDSMMQQHTATARVLFDPQVTVDSIITIGGLDRFNNGNWYIKQVVQTISGNSTNTTEMELSKYGSNESAKSAGDSAKGKINNETGPKRGEGKKTVPTYDSNSNEVK